MSNFSDDISVITNPKYKGINKDPYTLNGKKIEKTEKLNVNSPTPVSHKSEMQKVHELFGISREKLESQEMYDSLKKEGFSDKGIKRMITVCIENYA